MNVEQTALELIALTYDAALAPEKWMVLMERLVGAMGARSALLRDVDHDAGHVGIFETVGYDSSFVAAYREHFVHLDMFAPALVTVPIGAVTTGDAVVPWEQQRRSEFFNDYVFAQGHRHVLGSILARDNHHHLLFALQREAGQPDFDEDSLRLLRIVTPHMTKAVQIHRQMVEVTSQKHWAWSALDRLRVGVILLDERGRPLFLNHAAERLATGSKGFIAGRDGLVLPRADDTSRLRRLIADADGLATGRGAVGSGYLRAVMRGGDSVQFQVIPLPRGLSEQPWAPSPCSGCVAVFVSASGGPSLSVGRVAAMHGLTRAEAKLAALLAKGLALEEAAAGLSVSLHTVRSQLKSVFAKTGVTRQAELVALLLADMLNDQADDKKRPIQ